MRSLLAVGCSLLLVLWLTPDALATPVSPEEAMRDRISDPDQARNAPAFLEFQKRYSAEAQDPEAALKLWFDAALLTATAPTQESRETGMAMLGSATWAYRENENWYRDSGARTLRDVLRNRPYTLASYCKGASPTNGYDVDPGNYRLDLLTMKREKGAERARAVLACSGAETPRQVSLRRDPDSGLYYVETFVGLLPDVKPPQVGRRWR